VSFSRKGLRGSSTVAVVECVCAVMEWAFGRGGGAGVAAE
jgi:hypothetical protein